jgi:hypothetical protein
LPPGAQAESFDDPPTCFMTDNFPVAKTIEHGAVCDCKVLAQALHLDGRAISFDYCRRVLQMRWRLTCRHGSLEVPAAGIAVGERWRELGPMDPVKAILISNELSEA